MRTRAADEGVKSLLIMVDEEGELGNPGDHLRKQAVENHYKWVHAIKILGGHAIRVNAFGTAEKETLKAALVQGLGELTAYAQKEGIRVLIENHGMHTSDAAFIIDVIETVGNPYLGTLPDFGNWCLSAKRRSTQFACDQVYEPARGVAEFLPYAGGVSAKSYRFDSAGNEASINYPTLLQLVKDSGYKGYIGIEYEGEELSEDEGIRATKSLLETVWPKLQ